MPSLGAGRADADAEDGDEAPLGPAVLESLAWWGDAVASGAPPGAGRPRAGVAWMLADPVALPMPAPWLETEAERLPARPERPGRVDRSAHAPPRGSIVSPGRADQGAGARAQTALAAGGGRGRCLACARAPQTQQPGSGAVGRQRDCRSRGLTPAPGRAQQQPRRPGEGGSRALGAGSAVAACGRARTAAWQCGSESRAAGSGLPARQAQVRGQPAGCGGRAPRQRWACHTGLGTSHRVVGGRCVRPSRSGRQCSSGRGKPPSALSGWPAQGCQRLGPDAAARRARWASTDETGGPRVGPGRPDAAGRPLRQRPLPDTSAPRPR